MVSFIVGVIVGVVAGWVIPAPEKFQEFVDKIVSKIK
jgi:F0F1-type ATP synthase assembly protein I